MLMNLMWKARPSPVPVRIASKDVFRFLDLLDSIQRLALVREEEVRADLPCGAFAILKNRL